MDPVLADLIRQILSTVLQAAAVAVLGLATVWAKRISDKYGAKLTDDQQAHIAKLAKDAVYYAEEWAAKRGGAAAGANGEWKLGVAARYMAYRQPNLSPVVAKTVIHAALGSIAGVGASKTVGT
jgi:hypothetical protein